MLYYFPDAINDRKLLTLPPKAMARIDPFLVDLVVGSSDDIVRIELQEFDYRLVMGSDRVPCFSVIVVSEVFAKMLQEECADEIGFLPVRFALKNTGGSEIPLQYYAISVHRHWPAIDLEASDYNWSPDARDPTKQVILYFRTRILKEDLAGAPDVFRELAYPTTVLCSESFIRKCKKKRLRLSYLKFR